MAKREEHAEIVLGGIGYRIAPLTLDQLQEVAAGFDAMAGADGGLAARVKASHLLLTAAIGAEAAAAVRGATLLELVDAATVIARIAGLDDAKKRFAAAAATGE